VAVRRRPPPSARTGTHRSPGGIVSTTMPGVSTMPSPAAAARSVAPLQPLVEEYGDAVLPLELDVTDRTAVRSAVAQASQHLGSIDVLVNSAGYGHLGMVEELSEADVRDAMEVNSFGTLWVTQDVLPVMRGQRHGRILQVTSEGGVRTFPGFGAYHATEVGVEGLSHAPAPVPRQVLPAGPRGVPRATADLAGMAARRAGGLPRGGRGRHECGVSGAGQAHRRPGLLGPPG